MLFSSQPSDDLLSLVLPALKHRNRFVREAGYGCLTAFLPEEAAGEQNGQSISGGDFKRLIFCAVGVRLVPHRNLIIYHR